MHEAALPCRIDVIKGHLKFELWRCRSFHCSQEILSVIYILFNLLVKFIRIRCIPLLLYNIFYFQNDKTLGVNWLETLAVGIKPISWADIFFLFCFVESIMIMIYIWRIFLFLTDQKVSVKKKPKSLYNYVSEINPIVLTF